MTTVGHIKQIWRYPVKSMQGERLEHASLTTNGIVGDRWWAVRDEQAGETQGARKFPDLLLCSARFVDEPAPGRIPQVEITLRDGRTVTSDSPELAERVLEITRGKPASLHALRPPSDADFYRRAKRTEAEFAAEMDSIFQRAPGEPLPDLSQFPPEIIEFASLPGMFFDALPMHILTTASLAHMQGCRPESAWDVRRFRPNILIETAEEASGLVENDWVGRTLRIGEAEFDCAVATPRCGMITREQEGLPSDTQVLRSVVRDANQNLGVYANVSKPGALRVGDAVELV